MDLPGSDWNTVMSTIKSNPEISPQRHATRMLNLVIFTRDAPPRSILLFVSTISVHWMAGPPFEPAASLASAPFSLHKRSRFLPLSRRSGPARQAQIWPSSCASAPRSCVGPNEWLAPCGGNGGRASVLRENLRRGGRGRGRRVLPATPGRRS